MQTYRIIAIILAAGFVLSSCKSTISYYRKGRDFAGEHIDRCVDEALKCDDSNKGKGYCKGNTLNTEPLSKGKPCFVTKATKEFSEDVAEAGNKAQQELSKSLAPVEQHKAFTETGNIKNEKAPETLPLKETIKTEQEPVSPPAPVILRMPATPPENILPKIEEKPEAKQKTTNKNQKKKKPQKKNTKKPVKKKTKEVQKPKPVENITPAKPEAEKTDAEVLMEKQGLEPENEPVKTKEEVKPSAPIKETPAATPDSEVKDVPAKPLEIKPVEQLPEEMNNLSR